MDHKFVMAKCLKCLHISIGDKNVQSIGLKGNIN